MIRSRNAHNSRNLWQPIARSHTGCAMHNATALDGFVLLHLCKKGDGVRDDNISAPHDTHLGGCCITGDLISMVAATY